VRIKILRELRWPRVVVRELLVVSVRVVHMTGIGWGFSATLGNVAEQDQFGPGVFSL
jgi:hypothetical protein